MPRGVPPNRKKGENLGTKGKSLQVGVNLFPESLEGSFKRSHFSGSSRPPSPVERLMSLPGRVPGGKMVIMNAPNLEPAVEGTG
jgi:hypothetical protein